MGETADLENALPPIYLYCLTSNGNLFKQHADTRLFFRKSVPV